MSNGDRDASDVTHRPGEGPKLMSASGGAADRMAVRGIELEVVRRGAGQPILALHGMQPIDPRAPLPRHCWPSGPRSSRRRIRASAIRRGRTDSKRCMT